MPLFLLWAALSRLAISGYAWYEICQQLLVTHDDVLRITMDVTPNYNSIS